MQIVRYRSTSGAIVLGLIANGQPRGQFSGVETPALRDLLALRADAFRARVETVARAGAAAQPSGDMLAPIDGDTEVWAAGVTYTRSMSARMEESETPDIYAKVYDAARPELFFKATPRRVSGPGAPIVVRADSHWDVPEPELAIVVNAHGETVGYTIANDVSSRSIEGENPLYLPQAKVYAGACALGPGITPAWEIQDPYNLAIRMHIERGGVVHWEGETSTHELHRRLDELVAYLFRQDEFPGGVILCTGTALVPDPPFTLEAGDVVHISIDQLGTLSNPVVRGKPVN
ncbi:MAG TPA: fumarylacetoacetate hydrolase family protein [Ktedonobacteraceae bacterium]|nr:fumarylacetoacetate hydrolase family protein [Ktedonobacteraceae bacterium]